MIALVLNEQQQELAEKNHDLIYWYAKNHKLDLEEYYGDLAIELCNAAYHYNESLGYSFSSYAAKCMDNRIKQLIRNKKRTLEGNEEVLSLDHFYYEDDSDPITLEDCVSDDTKDTEKETVNKIETEWFADTLGDRDKYIFKSLLAGKQQNQIAKELGVSYPRVNMLVKKIRKKYEKLVLSGEYKR